MHDKSDLQEFSMHLSRREMRAYLDDKLTTEDATRMDKHLKFCDHCSVAMVTIVEQDDQSNYKRNINKIQHKLNVPVKKRMQLDSSKLKKGLIVAASICMLSFTAFAFYSVVSKNTEPGNAAKGIPVKPVKEKPLEKENNATMGTGTSLEDKMPDPKKLEKATEEKKDSQATILSKTEEKKENKPVVTPPATPLNKEENEKSVNEVSNSVLVARRKEQPAEENIVETKPTAEESTPGAEAKIMDANPTGGYGAFNQYLAGNLQYPAAATENKVEGQVPIEFLVEEDGSLSNFAIKKPLGFGCDKEAIRLIKDGPKWNPATENGKAISKKVAVTVNFKLEE
jgi:TonB family protein